MQYGEPFDSLYTNVIAKVASRKNLHAYRADEIYKPGVVLGHIIQSIATSDIVVAEITTLNPNIFYELGYAHAKNKTPILLAARDTKLPFDISGFRVILYDYTIKAKVRAAILRVLSRFSKSTLSEASFTEDSAKQLMNELEKHISAVLEDI